MSVIFFAFFSMNRGFRLAFDIFSGISFVSVWISFNFISSFNFFFQIALFICLSCFCIVAYFFPLFFHWSLLLCIIMPYFLKKKFKFYYPEGCFLEQSRIFVYISLSLSRKYYLSSAITFKEEWKLKDKFRSIILN